MTGAIFFDKDGTLIENIPYNVDPQLMRLTSGAANAVQALQSAGWRIFVVSNQAGVARGFFDAKDLTAVWRKLNELCGVEFDGFYFCPHHVDGAIEKYSVDCDCRKPAAGMLLQAAREHKIDLKNSWMIGDTASDVEAGQIAGCQAILLDQFETNLSKKQIPHFAVKSLTEAAHLILRSRESRRQSGFSTS